MVKQKITVFQVLLSAIFLYGCTHSASSADFENSVSLSHDRVNNLLIITSNAIPDHEIGEFPNKNNPNSISAQNLNYSIRLNPILHPENAPKNISTQGKISAIGVNGIPFDPFTAEYYDPVTKRRTQQKGLDWNFDGLGASNNGESLGMDFNRAHVQPNGTYHYHGRSPSLDTGSTKTHSPVIAFAADGYLILGQYGLNEGGEIVKMESCWRTKSSRSGSDAPSAADYALGTFVEDYEFDTACSGLDKYNGHFGKIPQSIVQKYIGYYDTGSYIVNADNTISMYHYHLTDTYPYIPRALVGTPHESFSKGPGRPSQSKKG